MMKSHEELAMMSPAELKAYKAEQQRIVFGADAKIKNGRPVEQGIGAPGRETENHFRAIGKWESPEAEKLARETAKANRKKAAA